MKYSNFLNYTCDRLVRISSLCDVLQDPVTAADCERWGLWGFVRDLLQEHTAQLEQSATMATTAASVWSYTDRASDSIVLARRLLLSIAVIVVSLTCWAAAEKSRSVLGDQVDLAYIILSSVRQSAPLASWTLSNMGAVILHHLLVAPLEQLQDLLTTILKAKTILGTGEGYPPSFIPSIVRRTGEVSSRNAQFFVVFVLLLPSLVIQRQFMSLNTITRLSDGEGLYAPQRKKESAEGAHRQDGIIERVLQRARRVLAVETVHSTPVSEKQPLIIDDTHSSYKGIDDLGAAIDASASAVGMEVEVRVEDGDSSLDEAAVEV